MYLQNKVDYGNNDGDGDDDMGPEAYSHHDILSLWWESVRDDDGGICLQVTMRMMICLELFRLTVSQSTCNGMHQVLLHLTPFAIILK